MSHDREKILEAIRTTGSISKAARELGVSRRTLQNRMRAVGLPEGKRGRPKKRFGKRRRNYAVAATAAAAVVGVALLARGRKQST